MKTQYVSPLYQLQTLLFQFNEATYGQNLSVLNGSSIGQHTRHILEFYVCLYAGIESGRVDYETRQRQTQIEQEPDFAQTLIQNLIQAFEGIKENKKMYLLVENEALETSLKRELHYLAEHSIHHLAMMRIGLQEGLPTIIFESDLGIAPSTLRYRQQLVSISA